MNFTHLKTNNVYTGVTVANAITDKEGFVPTLVYTRDGHVYARPLSVVLSKFATGLGIYALYLYRHAARGTNGEFINKSVPLNDNETLAITAYSKEGVLTKIIATKSHTGPTGEVFQVDIVELYNSIKEGTLVESSSLYNLALTYL